MINNKLILSIGSNLGDRQQNILDAINLLELNNVKMSSILQNKALLPENAPESWDIDFFNICLSTDIPNISPEEFLSKIHDVEAQLGRKKQRDFWSPRTIDIDIIYWGNLTLDAPSLTIPHKLAHKRDFCLLYTSPSPRDA